jgi:hypothetical protein
MKNTYKKHTESITITYLNTILVTIEVIGMEYLLIFAKFMKSVATRSLNLA